MLTWSPISLHNARSGCRMGCYTAAKSTGEAIRSLLDNYIPDADPSMLEAVMAEVDAYFAAHPRGTVRIERIVLRGRKRRHARHSGEKRRLTIQFGNNGRRIFIPDFRQVFESAAFTATASEITTRCRCEFFRGLSFTPRARVWTLAA